MLFSSYFLVCFLFFCLFFLSKIFSFFKFHVTCVGGRDALGEDAVSDDVEHAEGEHHRHDGEAEMEDVLHVGLRPETQTERQEEGFQ